MQVNSLGAAYASAPQIRTSYNQENGAVPMFQDLVLNSVGDDVAFTSSPTKTPHPLAQPFGSLSGFAVPV